MLDGRAILLAENSRRHADIPEECGGHLLHQIRGVGFPAKTAERLALMDGIPDIIGPAVQTGFFLLRGDTQDRFFRHSFQ